MRENGFPTLKKFRLEKKMSQKEFANSIGINLSTYNNYETGAREPSSDFWITLSQKYNVSIDFLLGLNKKNSAPAKAETKDLAPDKIELLDDYDLLNDDGKVAARSAVKGLTYAPNYKKSDKSKFLEENA